MDSKWLKEVKNIIDGEVFSAWWRELGDLKLSLVEARRHHEELLGREQQLTLEIERQHHGATVRLDEAMASEDEAARVHADSAAVENRAFEAVANFETQRLMVSELWLKATAAEHHLESKRVEMNELEEKLSSSSDKIERSQLEGVLKRVKAEVKKLAKEHEKHNQVYKRESESKQVMWQQVEELWSNTLELNLRVAERRQRAARLRRETERTFRKAEADKQSVSDLRQQVEKAESRLQELEGGLQELRREANERLHCFLEEDFLYWRQRESQRQVYCVPLIDDEDNYNMSIKALNIYRVDRGRGVEFIEPISPEEVTPEEEDRRIDDFFSKDRPVERLKEEG